MTGTYSLLGSTGGFIQSLKRLWELRKEIIGRLESYRSSLPVAFFHSQKNIAIKMPQPNMKRFRAPAKSYKESVALRLVMHAWRKVFLEYRAAASISEENALIMPISQQTKRWKPLVWKHFGYHKWRWKPSLRSPSFSNIYSSLLRAWLAL